MDALTICAINYLPFATVLGRSFLNYHENSNFYVLVTDGDTKEFKREKDFRYITPQNLELENSKFKNMSFYYDVTELATALKPSALKFLLHSGSKKVIYLDPDIEIFGSLDEVSQALDENYIVLTPHTLEPIPRDQLRPSEVDILCSGTFNLGFIGISNSKPTEVFLNWWEERLEFDCISNPKEMLFTDQRWIDFVPSYFDYHVLRHPGYNVAYWNLHERVLSQNGEKIYANNLELKFFHFSGYNPNKPWILSKYVSDKPRVLVSKNPLLSFICSRYGEQAKSFGWNQTGADEYGFDKFENGKRIPKGLRRLYRENCIDDKTSGRLTTPPENWTDWATQRTIDSGNLSRLLFSIWKDRPDLQRRFPDATGKEFSDFQAWAGTHGVLEGVIDSEFLGIGNLESDTYPDQLTKDFGVNVAGYLKGEFGLGQSARLILNATTQARIPVATLDSNRTLSRKEEKSVTLTGRQFFPTTISVVNADHFSLWVNDIGEKISNSTKIIGVWAWEIEDFPPHMHKSFNLVDEIWTVSNFVKNSIAKHTDKKVFVYPNQITKPKIIEKINRDAFGLDEQDIYNLFIFDYASVFNRKNPIGLVNAHKLAFPNSEGPKLVIKTINGDQDPENRELLRYSVKDRNDIILFEDYLSRDQLNSLLNECGAYVSLHRSEGYGITLAEAMALGKPVIATGYSGNLDFMNSKNSILIPYVLTKIGPNSEPYPHDSFWAEPDIDKAAQELRRIFFNDEARTQLGKHAAEVVNQFTVNRSAEFILNRVKSNSLKLAFFRRKSKTIYFRVIAKITRRIKKYLNKVIA